MKLVEVIRGVGTSDETFAAVQAFAVAIGKEPVEVKECPGFVVNRILIPMSNEAVGLYAEGIASAEGIDTGHAPWLQPPDGTASTRRPHWP